MALIDQAHIDDTLTQFRGQRFTTFHFIEVFKTNYPDDWGFLRSRFGQGGKRCGTRYSINNYFGKALGDRAKRGEINFVEWTPTPPPDGWGSPVIALWERS